MIAEKTGDLAKLERDLRRVLSISPDDASALNALGYTLANRTQRLDEAYDYISRALALRPNDPAILDSMGWVLYKRGELEAARDYLRRAYEKFPDPEVAAHYGEVLWVLGAQNQARQVWRDTLQSNPDAPISVKSWKNSELACDPQPHANPHPGTDGPDGECLSAAPHSLSHF